MNPLISIEQFDRKHYRLTAQQWLPESLDVAFAFFADATKLESIMHPSMKFRVLTPTPIDIATGTIIDYKLSVRRIPIHWTSKITVWEPMKRFVDVQIRGPYRIWKHEHSFDEKEHGTLLRDRVDYRPPGGRLFHRLFVKPDLLKIFRYRYEKLEKIFSKQ